MADGHGPGQLWLATSAWKALHGPTQDNATSHYRILIQDARLSS